MLSITLNFRQTGKHKQTVHGVYAKRRSFTWSNAIFYSNSIQHVILCMLALYRVTRV